jgi:hypothetical protein
VRARTLDPVKVLWMPCPPKNFLRLHDVLRLCRAGLVTTIPDANYLIRTALVSSVPCFIHLGGKYNSFRSLHQNIARQLTAIPLSSRGPLTMKATRRCLDHFLRLPQQIHRDRRMYRGPGAALTGAFHKLMTFSQVDDGSPGQGR